MKYLSIELEKSDIEKSLMHMYILYRQHIATDHERTANVNVGDLMFEIKFNFSCGSHNDKLYIRNTSYKISCVSSCYTQVKFSKDANEYILFILTRIKEKFLNNF